MADANILSLPAVLDLRAATPLKDSLDGLAGAPLDLDASKVERLGGLCLQILLAASAAWGGAGHGFRTINASEAFRDDLRLMGAANLLPAPDHGSAQPC
jgi:chemotaxis protein CheX